MPAREFLRCLPGLWTASKQNGTGASKTHGACPILVGAFKLLLGLRLQFLFGLLAHLLEIAPHHLARRLVHALLLDGFRRFLACLLDVAGDLGAGLLAE